MCVLLYARLLLFHFLTSSGRRTNYRTFEHIAWREWVGSRVWFAIFFRSFLNRQETQLSLIKTARSTRLDVSQGHQTYSTIRYVRYGFILLCYRNHVCKTQCFWGIRLQKCRDLENRVKGLWRWLKLWPFIRQFVCFPAWGLTTLSAQRGYSIISCHRRMKYILCRAGGTHRNIDKPKKRKI